MSFLADLRRWLADPMTGSMLTGLCAALVLRGMARAAIAYDRAEDAHDRIDGLSARLRAAEARHG